MFKRILVSCCIMIASQASQMFAADSDWEHSTSISYSTQLEDIITTIQQLPEAQKLIASIQKEGALRIIVNKQIPVCEQFGACWDPDNRIICVNTVPTSRHSKGAVIGSILFELHNASVNSQINYYDSLAARGEIEKEDYVRSIEFLEYENSIKTAQMAEKGIQAGLFPANARLPTYSNFEEHYYFQKVGGHSAWIAHNYNQLRLGN